MNLQRTFSKWLVRGLRAARRVPFIGSALVRASFDAVRQTWGERSILWHTLQDAWLEIDQCSRHELQRQHDALVENSCLVQKIRSLYVQFSVGPAGLTLTPNASRWSGPENSPEEKKQIEQWNLAKAQSWENWWRRPELNSEISGAQLTRVWSGLLFDKGEIFVHLTEESIADAKGVKRALTPRVETIDAHRCETPPEMREYQGNCLCDGAEVTPAGKVVAYWFRGTNFDALLTGNHHGVEKYQRLPVYDEKTGRRKLIHKFKRRRPGHFRGIPEGFSVYNLVRDNMDLHKLEMQCAKISSTVPIIETNASGELDAADNWKARLGVKTTGPDNTATTTPSYADYKVHYGAQNVALKTGDKMEQFMINRPTVATQDYWDLQNTLICVGYGVPKLLVLPESLQGTVTRADLDVASYGFGREHFEVIAELLREVYEWQTEWAVNYDRSLDGEAPEDYAAVVIRPPRAPNVDIGYTAAALEKELMLGVRTIPEVYAERQQDFRQKTREIAEYLKFVQDTAKEFGVPAAKITNLLEGTGDDPAEAGEPAEPEEGEPKQIPITTATA